MHTGFERQISALKILNEIAAISDIDPKETLRRALAVGRDFLGVDFGIVSRITDEVYEIKVQSSPPDTLNDDMEFALGITYCSITLKASDVVAIDDMGNSPYFAHPCFEAFKLSTYIGAPITVDGRLYGTINFSSPATRQLPFGEADIEFVRLLAKWAGAYLERQDSLEKLRRINEALSERVEMDREALIQSEKMARLGNMLGAIIHQWKQPLNAIGIESQSLRMYCMEDEYEKEEFVKGLSFILSQVDFMSKTADGFRDFYKPSKEKTQFSISDQIQNVANIVGRQFHQKSISFEIKTVNDPIVYGYESEFKQVILNILNNAYDAVVQSNVKNPCITVCIDSKNGFTDITIEDNAGGINEELLPQKLFEPFVSMKGKKGTGIGLSLSKTIIEERMGGTLSAINGEFGAIFKIELPLHG